ncbi:MAG: hypothetical protein ACRYG5_04080 [Janthinobacterium lividum]
MKEYVFAISLMLMLGLALAGLARSTAVIFERLDLSIRPVRTLSLATAMLIALIYALTWSVSPQA